MLREAGFHPLEVLRSATLIGAKILGSDDEIGSIQVGKRADLILVRENPLANLKTLYATGHIRLNRDGEAVRVGGIDKIIRGGVVYDGIKLRQNIRQMVKEEKDKQNIGPGPMPIVGFELQ